VAALTAKRNSLARLLAVAPIYPVSGGTENRIKSTDARRDMKVKEQMP
jgi:hypothetical protein